MARHLVHVETAPLLLEVVQHEGVLGAGLGGALMVGEPQLPGGCLIISRTRRLACYACFFGEGRKCDEQTNGRTYRGKKGTSPPYIWKVVF